MIIKHIISSLFAVLFILFISPGLISGMAHSQNNDDSIRQALVSYGLQQVDVSFDGNTIQVRYLQPVNEIESLQEAATRIAEIAKTVRDVVPDQNTIQIQQRYDDGQIISITVQAEDAIQFLNSSIGRNTLIELADIQLLTRGLWIVPDTCEPDSGDSCLYNRACACYGNEECDPTSSAADDRGCVEMRAPMNAYLVGTEYVCNDGFNWNADLADCVPKLLCPKNAFEFQGECYCMDGYHWNKNMAACIAGEYPRIDGDYNGDEQITVLDALAALKMSVGSLEEDMNLDMDHNGRITAVDARQILNMAVNRK